MDMTKIPLQVGPACETLRGTAREITCSSACQESSSQREFFILFFFCGGPKWWWRTGRKAYYDWAWWTGPVARGRSQRRYDKRAIFEAGHTERARPDKRALVMGSPYHNILLTSLTSPALTPLCPGLGSNRTRVCRPFPGRTPPRRQLEKSSWPSAPRM